MRLHVKVVPGASRDAVVGLTDGTLKLRVVAAPERGKANAAVARLIADTLGVPVAAIRIVAGHTSPRKVIEIEGVDEADLQERFRGVSGRWGPRRGERG